MTSDRCRKCYEAVWGQVYDKQCNSCCYIEIDTLRAKVEKADLLYARAIDIIEYGPTRDIRECSWELFYNLSKAAYHYNGDKTPVNKKCICPPKKNDGRFNDGVHYYCPIHGR